MDAITTVLTTVEAFKTSVVAKGRSFSLEQTNAPIAVTQVTTGLTGRDGTQGAAQVSADADNQLTQGTDQKLFVPPPQLASAQW